MQTITIMPDFGNSPYAWLKESTDQSEYVGINVGAYLCKPTEFAITDDLHDRFVAWCLAFEIHHAEQNDFDWKEFHKNGLSLKNELLGIVGPNFNIVYMKPVEDPSSTIHEVKNDNPF
jgi:hypothetical protein